MKKTLFRLDFQDGIYPLSSYLYDGVGLTKLPSYSTSLNTEIGSLAAKYAAGGAISGGTAGVMVTTSVDFGMSEVEPWIVSGGGR